MRKGFSSSRGAIRGTIGGAPVGRVGTGGFATVAISFGPFLCSGLKTLGCYRTTLLFLQRNSGVGGEFLRCVHKRIAAFLGAKENRLPAAAAFRERQSLGQVHSADRVTNQFSGQSVAWHINRCLLVSSAPAHAVHQA